MAQLILTMVAVVMIIINIPNKPEVILGYVLAGMYIKAGSILRKKSQPSKPWI